MNAPTKVEAKSPNEVFLRRASKLIVPKPAGHPASAALIATFFKRLEFLGYTASLDAANAIRSLSERQLVELNEQITLSLAESVGAHRVMVPMYKNFPREVMQMNDAALYLTALLHYLTDGVYIPDIPKDARNKFVEPTYLKRIGLGTQADLESIFTHLAASNSSISQTDMDDLRWFIATYKDGISALMPQHIPHREVRAVICASLIEHTKDGKEKAAKMCDTATDVLRVAVALSGGDVSLAEPCRFQKIARSTRKTFLAILESQRNPVEDMLRWKSRWIRLGERLHPGEFKKTFPDACRAFDTIRNNEHVESFNGDVEQLLEQKRFVDAVGKLQTRPGELARRLDHILRSCDEPTRAATLRTFADCAVNISTPLLLQLRNHFVYRNDFQEMRIFLPKGQVAKAQAIPNTLPSVPEETAKEVVKLCEDALTKRFSKLPPLGRCYIDPELRNYLVPFSQRSASKSLRTASRGSRLPMPVDKDTLRFFVWWKNGKERTDLDLSASTFDEKFAFISSITWYNLKDFGGCHSGDIVDAPLGASEFIDLSRTLCRERGVRYIVMSINSYTQQPYCDLPECFAGWMSRQSPESGEIYEPKTVEDKLDISANTRIALPAIFDLKENRVIWADMALTQWPYWYNTVAANLWGIQLTLKSLVQLQKPNLYDLFSLHATARGELCHSRAEADTVFDVETGSPFDLPRIAAEFMAT